jgi:hypothetical protein
MVRLSATNRSTNIEVASMLATLADSFDKSLPNGPGLMTIEPI